MIECTDVRNFDIQRDVIVLPEPCASVVARHACGREIVELHRLDQPFWLTDRGIDKAAYRLVEKILLREVHTAIDEDEDNDVLGQDDTYLTEFEARPFLRALSAGGFLFEVDSV